MTRILTLMTLMAAVPAVAFAAGAAIAPEIDGTTAIAALALLGGATLVIRSRRKK